MHFLENFWSKKKFFFIHFFSRFVKRWKRRRLEMDSLSLLKRKVLIDVFLPPGYGAKHQNYPLLLLNDGQDMEAVQLMNHLKNLLQKNKMAPIIVAAVHAADRMQEYGTIDKVDYKNRGRKASAYGQFITRELIPLLQKRYQLESTPKRWAIAGFSLGGLSAIDLAWHYPQIFQQVGVFSGSFWWRSKAFKPTDPDADRILHETISQGPKRAGMTFWLQTGTKDEQDDRNNNGVIDSIDDTLDLIQELKKLGYQMGKDIEYVEVEDGEHNTETWGKVMPRFLEWAFPYEI